MSKSKIIWLAILSFTAGAQLMMFISGWHVERLSIATPCLLMGFLGLFSSDY